MKMITDSLEKVYTAMGGADEFNKDDIAEGIEQISEVAGSGGSGGGVAESFQVVTFTQNADSSYTCEFTYNELAVMSETALKPYLIKFLSVDGELQYSYLVDILESHASSQISGNSYAFKQVDISADGSGTMEAYVSYTGVAEDETVFFDNTTMTWNATVVS